MILSVRPTCLLVNLTRLAILAILMFTHGGLKKTIIQNVSAIHHTSLKTVQSQLRNRSRTLSATKLASSPSRAKFRDDSHWETYLEDEALVWLLENKGQK